MIFKRGLIVNGAELLEPTTIRHKNRARPGWVCRIGDDTIKIIAEVDLRRSTRLRISPAQRSRNQIYAGYKYRAQRDNIFFSLTVEEFGILTQQRCAYCGCEPRGKEWKTGWRYNGLDRKRNTKGYVPGNVIPACGWCNSLKSDKLTYEEMKAAMEGILRIRKKRR